jgi:hypothetical protein
MLRDRCGNGRSGGAVNRPQTIWWHAGEMPARPEATRARLNTIADALAHERGGVLHVTVADLRERLNDAHGRIGRWHAEWCA